MFQIIWSCISQLWDLLCESMSFTNNSRTPSSPPSDSMPCTTNSQIPSSSPSESVPCTTDSQTKYDVFLSFRGKDTRLNFTGHLYSALDRHGVRIFMDDPELRSGEVISDALLDAIRKSKAYIVVLSENYASSSWCLDELVEIFNCHKTAKRSVIPVFYKIDPSVARHQIGSFKQAFKKHQVRVEMEKVNKWSLTLTQVADFSGFHICENTSEADVIHEIVHELLLNINPKDLDVTKYPVGLDSRVKAITTLLSTDTKGVIKFGIYGMGGVGKTTLAKALFNQLVRGGRFKGSCFLANVRENSGTTKGLVSLQLQLINDVLSSTTKVEVHNVDQGIKLIEARICSTKIVVVIDDLDDLNQFQSLVGPFASESVVIITTRDEEILIKTEVETRYRYMVNTLDEVDSLALFKRHAFGDAEPNDTFMELSKDILCLAAGLPLALEIFGSYLYKRSEIGWKSYIEKLHRNPNSSIQKRLVISLDALGSDDDPNLKKIFLDIACCFIGWGKQDVVQIIDSYYLYADNYIDMLKKRCLLTIDSDDRLGMHDLLQDMGREIAHNNSPDEPGKHSRLWVTEDICDVLKNHKGTEAIECIIFRKKEFPPKEIAYTTETFQRISKLRFLYLNKVNLTGSFEHTLDDLRWLCWDQFPLECLPSEFYVKNLVILELPYSNMRTMWELNMESHVFGKLKTLNMAYSSDLITTPDFTKLPCLETLDLHRCTSLKTVHVSIGSLGKLVSLNLEGCEKLKTLPDELWKITSLRELNASYTRLLKKLPDIGSSQIALSLQELDLSKSGITALPSGFSQLSNLQELDLSKSGHLLSIPKLPPNLKMIWAFGCGSLERIPNLSNLKHLETLNLTDCWALTEIQGLQELTSITDLRLVNLSCSLVEYNLTKPLFQLYSEFGRSIRVYVSEFIYWKIDGDWIIESPYWTSGSSRSTTELTTTMYAHLLPNESHNFMGIILCFQEGEDWGENRFGYSVKNTASGFIWSDNYLDVPVCDSLMVIVPKSIFSVRDDDHRIELTADNSVKILGIHLLYNTETEMIEDVAKKHVIDIDELKLVDPVLQAIFLDIACFFIGWKKEEVVHVLETYYPDAERAVDILKKRCLLTIDDSDELEMNDLLQNIGRKIARNSSPDEPGRHSRLWLSIDIFDVLKKQKGTKAIEGIIPHKLGYQDALKGESFTMETFKKMSKLRFLYLKNVNLTGSFEQTLKDLRWLCWDKCPLECLPSDFYPQKLVILELPHSQLRTMWEPNMVPHVFDKLKTLNMSYSLDLTTTPDFSKLPCLETLNFEYCKSLEEVHMSIGGLVKLSSLNLHDCVNLETLPDTICNLRMLRCLDIRGCNCLEALPIELGNFESLTELKARGSSVSKSLKLSNLKQLEELHLSFCSGLTEIQGLDELTSIKRLYLEGCTSSQLAYNLTKRLFQIYSGLKHHIDIAAPEFPDWIGELYDGSKMSLKFPLNVSQNFLGMILCFKRLYCYAKSCAKKTIGYYVENTTTGFRWRGTIYKSYYTSLMVIVPRSVFPIKDGEEIELTSPYARKCKIHLLYKSEYDNTTVDIKDERSNPSDSDLESNKRKEEEDPSKRLKQSGRDNCLSV